MVSFRMSNIGWDYNQMCSPVAPFRVTIKWALLVWAPMAPYRMAIKWTLIKWAPVAVYRMTIKWFQLVWQRIQGCNLWENSYATLIAHIWSPCHQTSIHHGNHYIWCCGSTSMLCQNWLCPPHLSPPFLAILFSSGVIFKMPICHFRMYSTYLDIIA